jgi:UDP-3-O-[3-hydroxymyristoyl] N-acetylglucosamine deacetylase
LFGESLDGIGLHTGRPARIAFEPGRPASGVVFVRDDLPGAPEVPATAESVVSTDRATSLAVGDVRIGTVEHVLAALFALGRSDARVHSLGPEIPILDGSAAPLLPLVRALPACARRPVRPTRAIEIGLDERRPDVRLSIEPADLLTVEIEIAFDPPVGLQTAGWDGTPEDFATNVAPARTFAFESDYRALVARGLATGANADSGVLFGESGPIVGGPLRFADEPARHKLLDLVGDLALLGRPLLARVRASRTGHGAAIRLVRALSEPGVLEGS